MLGVSMFRDTDSIVVALEEAQILLVFWSAHTSTSEAVREEHERSFVL
jgi:hypothetical protein